MRASGSGLLDRRASRTVALVLVSTMVTLNSVQVHRCDIVMDIGESMSPAVDIGQIEGAFIQVSNMSVKWLPCVMHALHVRIRICVNN